MGFRIKYCMSGGPYLKKKAWFFVYLTRWGFCTELLGGAATRADAEAIVKRAAEFQPYCLDYDKYGNIDI